MIGAGLLALGNGGTHTSVYRMIGAATTAQSTLLHNHPSRLRSHGVGK